MENWQKIFIFIFSLFALSGLLKGFYEVKSKKNSFGSAGIYNIIGAFVWGDAVVFGIFWIFVSGLVIILNDRILFLLITSVFWFVRGLGETIYWLNQQFSKIDRNPPERFWIYKIFGNDSVWFVQQIFWQCISVISILFTIYFAKIWF